MSNETRISATEQDPRWALLAARDRASDGQFYYSVRTTGVYCRPGCAARLPRPENVAFYKSAAEAQEAGFRPCKRCRPDRRSPAEETSGKIAAACRRIETAQEFPAFRDLARDAGLSPFHFHREFKKQTGLTPKQYAAAHRDLRIRKTLTGSERVTDAIYEAGYSSNSRFYETSNGILGMTPSHFREGGREMEIRFAAGECSLGSILVAATSIGVCAILLGDDPEALVHNLEERFPRAELIGADPEFEHLVARVVGLVEAPGLGLDLPLDIRGTAFQRRVWQALRDIPAGSTASYSDIAKAIGRPQSARAVARACAGNSLAVAIPCHRVVRSDGDLSGYRWGVERKRALLDREANDAPKAMLHNAK